jgi:hypothetical protein
VWELLVKWTGQSEADTTWEQLEDFKDELFAGEVGNVVDSFIGSKYQRRSKMEIATKVARIGNQINPRIKEICACLFP